MPSVLHIQRIASFFFPIGSTITVNKSQLNGCYAPQSIVMLATLHHLSSRPTSGERRSKNLLNSPAVSLLEPAISTPLLDFVR